MPDIMACGRYDADTQFVSCHLTSSVEFLRSEPIILPEELNGRGYYFAEVVPIVKFRPARLFHFRSRSHKQRGVVVRIVSREMRSGSDDAPPGQEGWDEPRCACIASVLRRSLGRRPAELKVASTN